MNENVIGMLKRFKIIADKNIEIDVKDSLLDLI